MVRTRIQSLVQALVLLAVTCAVGCNRGTTPSEDSRKIQVLSAVFPLADLARQVGGPYVQVEWLCEAGQDPRDIPITDELRRRIAKADLLIGSGYGDQWAKGGGTGGTQEMDRMVRPEITEAGRVRPVDRADLWLDPAVAREVIDQIRQKLAVADPKHEPDFRRNAVEAVKKLDALDARLREELAPLKGRKFLVLRQAWTYFAERYGLEEIAPIEVPVEPLSAEDARKLRAAAKTAGTDLLVVDAYLPSGVQHQIESQTHLKLLPLDRLGSSAPDARSTYQRIMEYNLSQLLKGMK